MTTSGSATCGLVPVALLAGDNTKGHPAGTKPGDVIHMFKSGSIQMVTDVSIDPAGNVWAANNWNLSRSGRRRKSGPSHLDLGRRVGLHRDLWSGGAGEAAAHRQGADLLTKALSRRSQPRSIIIVSSHVKETMLQRSVAVAISIRVTTRTPGWSASRK